MSSVGRAHNFWSGGRGLDPRSTRAPLVGSGSSRRARLRNVKLPDVSLATRLQDSLVAGEDVKKP